MPDAVPRTIDAPGIYAGFPVEAYFADPCPTPSLNQSTAKLLLERSPLHAMYGHPRLTPLPPEDKVESYVADRAIGNASHALILGRGKPLAIGDFDAWTTKEAKAFKSDAYADGDEPILRKHYERACQLAEAAKQQLQRHESSDCFRGEGQAEVVLAWQEDGLWFRTMIDWLTADLCTIDDLKTTGTCAAPDAIGRLMDDAGWPIQAAMWERGLNVIDPANAGRRKYRFVCVENDPPYALTVNVITEAELVIGRAKLARAIKSWRHCIESGHWPAYSMLNQYPETPGYRRAQWEMAEGGVA